MSCLLSLVPFLIYCLCMCSPHKHFVTLRLVLVEVVVFLDSQTVAFKKKKKVLFKLFFES